MWFYTKFLAKICAETYCFFLQKETVSSKTPKMEKAETLIPKHILAEIFGRNRTETVSVCPLDLIHLMVDGVPLAHVQLVACLGLPALDQVFHHLFQRVSSVVLRLATQILKVSLLKMIMKLAVIGLIIYCIQLM